MSNIREADVPVCGQYFQADVALAMKCGMPAGHEGTHGWCNQTVLRAARDVAAERKAAAGGWSPIATYAPKFGETVWTWDDARGGNPSMLCDGVWLITYDDAEIHPTHWMPLPAPPASALSRVEDTRRQTEEKDLGLPVSHGLNVSNQPPELGE